MRAYAALAVATVALAGCQWLASIDAKFDPGGSSSSSSAGGSGGGGSGAAGGGGSGPSAGGGGSASGGGGGFMCPDPSDGGAPPCLTMCNGTCTDTTTDPKHCGSCSVACDAGVRCDTGICGRSLFRGAGSDALSAVKHNDGGYLWSWGDNSNLQGGVGSTDQLYQPTLALWVPGCLRYSASSGSSTCVLTTAGGVDCFGNNSVGQVGDGTYYGPVECADKDHGCVEIPSPTILGHVAEIAGIGWWTGGWHFCARTTSGNVSCWGNLRACGSGNTAPTPTPVDDVHHVVMLAVGSGFDCMLVADGTVWCRGANCGGELGQGDTLVHDGTVQVPGLTGVTVIGAGIDTVCAQASDGVYCWGANAANQAGDPSGPTKVTSPTRLADVPGFQDLVQIVGSAEAMFGLTAAGEVYGWGRGDYGIAGNGSLGLDLCPNGALSCYTSPTKAAISEVAEIAAGDTTVIVRLHDGSLWGWGGNDRGQLGVDTTSTAANPWPVQVHDFP